MSNSYRYSPFGNPVVVAEGRGSRPHDARHHDLHAPPDVDTPAYDPRCPFCTGNEAETPPEVAAFRDGAGTRDTPGWTVRVVPNKFPAFGSGEGAEPAHDPFAPSLLVSRPALGRHEVAIHSPDHSGRLSTLPPEKLAVSLQMWQERLSAHRSEGWVATALSVNEGREAGASLAHPHAQLFGLDEVPPQLASELHHIADWEQIYGRPLLPAIVDAESQGPRFVDREGDLVAWAPYWSQVPHEVWLAPADPDSDTGALAESPNTTGLAELLSRVTRRIRLAAGDPALNLILRDPLHQTGEGPHWHLRILPRTSIAAGFELSAGTRIVAVPPEAAAATLREIG